MRLLPRSPFGLLLINTFRVSLPSLALVWSGVTPPLASCRAYDRSTSYLNNYGLVGGPRVRVRRFARLLPLKIARQHSSLPPSRHISAVNGSIPRSIGHPSIDRASLSLSSSVFALKLEPPLFSHHLHKKRLEIYTVWLNTGNH